MTQGRTILAIDPGPDSSAWMMYCKDDGVLWRNAHETNERVRMIVLDKLAGFDVVACEMIASYGMPVGREVFDTCYFIGQIWCLCDQRGIPFIRVYRKDVKLALCGTPRAKDANVRQALIDLLGKPGTKKAPGPTYGVSGHAWSALAIAWYAAKQLEGKEAV